MLFQLCQIVFSETNLEDKKFKRGIQKYKNNKNPDPRICTKKPFGCTIHLLTLYPIGQITIHELFHCRKSRYLLIQAEVSTLGCLIYERWVNLQRIGDMSMVDLDQCMNWKGEERCHLQKETKLDIFNFAKFSNCCIYCREEVDRISSNLFAFDNLNLKGRIC